MAEPENGTSSAGQRRHQGHAAPAGPRLEWQAEPIHRVCLWLGVSAMMRSVYSVVGNDCLRSLRLYPLTNSMTFKTRRQRAALVHLGRRRFAALRSNSSR